MSEGHDKEFLCPGFAPFAYDAVVMHALAMNEGIRRGMFTRDTVSRELLLAAHTHLVNNPSYGGCLAAGPLTYNDNQERSSPLTVRNWTPEGGPVGEVLGN